MQIPEALNWWREEPGGGEWLDRLPRLVQECGAGWSLELGPPFGHAHVSFVAAATRKDGTAAVLKINFPETETEFEANALAHWDGRGAVRLLEHDPERRALLVERCDPGSSLWDVPDEEQANRTAARVLLSLWRPPPAGHPFVALADEGPRWADRFLELWEEHGRPFERRLAEQGAELARELAGSQGEVVVCHQDFHGGNVLRSERGWLAIDPKPLVGEREFDTASLVRDRRDDLLRDPDPRRRVRRRLDQLSEELGLDRERMRGWGLVHALWWGSGSAQMIACARLLAGG